uniref:Uncharacterized protein n=1 Tax=Romanomermis culicivorax TaxID=13658 RepID=A0A915JXP9_ROMCU
SLAPLAPLAPLYQIWNTKPILNRVFTSDASGTVTGTGTKVPVPARYHGVTGAGIASVKKDSHPTARASMIGDPDVVDPAQEEPIICTACEDTIIKTSMANMIMLSKEVAMAAPIVSPRIVLWAGTAQSANDLATYAPLFAKLTTLRRQ